jgi:hypothetical protein
MLRGGVLKGAPSSGEWAAINDEVSLGRSISYQRREWLREPHVREIAALQPCICDLNLSRYAQRAGVRTMSGRATTTA